MIKYEDSCVDCGLPCLGESCSHKHVPLMFCDKCKQEVDRLFYSPISIDAQLCEDCVLEELEEVDIDK